MPGMCDWKRDTAGCLKLGVVINCRLAIQIPDCKNGSIFQVSGAICNLKSEIRSFPLSPTHLYFHIRVQTVHNRAGVASFL
jgi:hypothetical protein